MISNVKIPLGQYESIITENESTIFIGTSIRVDKVSNEITFTENTNISDVKILRCRIGNIPILSLKITSAMSIQPTDVGWILEVDSATNIDLTINENSLEKDGDITHIDQINSGKGVLVAGVGVTLQYKSGHLLSTDGQYTRVSIQRINSNIYRIISN